MLSELVANLGAVTATGQSSQTALLAAAARAAHLIVDRPPYLFVDPLAERLLGDEAERMLSFHRAQGDHPILRHARTQVVCRSRYTENRLAELAATGTGQYVVLGAGLDSFGYRQDPARGVRVFEVDRPTSGRDKRARVERAGLDASLVRYVGVDFEAGRTVDGLVDGLVDEGFDPSSPALVSWLGVTMYLTGEAIGGTLSALATLAPGTEIIFDYMAPERDHDAAGREYVTAMRAAMAGFGEPWRTFLTPDDVTALLTGHGLEPVEHVRQHDVVGADGWRRDDTLRPSTLVRFTRARVPVRTR